jgi:hypothetical protein
LFLYLSHNVLCLYSLKDSARWNEISDRLLAN